jgi:hypothetical protein
MEQNVQSNPDDKDSQDKKPNGTRIDFTNPGNSNPVRVLPSDRIAMDKQLEMLRAFVVASQSENGNPVTNDTVGRVMQMKGATVMVMNAFFKDVGLLMLASAGKFLPSQYARDYEGKYKWDKEAAGLKLAPALEDRWFAQAISPIVQMKPLRKSDAVTILAEASKSSPKYRDRLEMLIELLSIAGIVSFDGDQLTAGRGKSAAAESTDKRNEHGSGGGSEDPPPPPPTEEGIIPAGSPFFFPDRQRQKKVVIVAKSWDLSGDEWKRLQAWFELQFFVQGDKQST